ncbi:MAG: hypothetical protein DCC49_12090, partial [Acidobacteria bacterium]
AYAEYLGQQHVFSHGLSPTGQDILRHGYYDIGVGTWIFETLDEGFSGGVGISTMVWGSQLHFFNWLSGTWLGLRHGWYEPGAGWKFETLIESVPISDFTSATSPTALPFATVPLDTVALADPSGGQSVFVSTREAGACWLCTPYSLSHGRYPGANGSWSFSKMPPVNLVGFAEVGGRGASVTTYGSHTEIFGYRFGYNLSCDSIYHAFWDGVSWQTEAREVPCTNRDFEQQYTIPTAATSYPPFNQLHAFYTQFPLAMGHFWYNPG